MRTKTFLLANFVDRVSVVGLLVLGLALSGCDDDTGALLGGRPNRDPNAPTSGDASTDGPAANLTCAIKPQARAYLGFDGSHLEANRRNESTGVNRARKKPYSVLAGEYRRVLGLVPASLNQAVGSFDEAPDRWFVEPIYGGVSLSAMFDLSFEACVASTNDAPEYANPPTAETATQACARWIRKAWSRTGSPEEIATCVDLAQNKLGAETDPRKRWAYVCASVLSSSSFLTF